MRLRYQGGTPREGWAPSEEREVSSDEAAALLATGLFVAVLVAPVLTGPPAHRRIMPPCGQPWR